MVSRLEVGLLLGLQGSLLVGQLLPGLGWVLLCQQLSLLCWLDVTCLLKGLHRLEVEVEVFYSVVGECFVELRSDLPFSLPV